jgi:hypothetical protein
MYRRNTLGLAATTGPFHIAALAAGKYRVSQ